MQVKVKSIKVYNDAELGHVIDKIGTEFVVDKKRADVLVEAGVCEIVEVIKKEKETATIPRKKANKSIKKETAKK